MDNGSEAAKIRNLVLSQIGREEVLELTPGHKVRLREPSMLIRDGFRTRMEESYARGMMYLVAACAYDYETGARLFEVDQVDDLAALTTDSYAFRMADKIVDMMKEGVEAALGKSVAETGTTSPSSPSATPGESAPSK